MRASSDPMDAQRLADFQQAMGRFERRLHDLKLTRQVAIQTAPQIRLIQGNDTNLVEKIQSSILNTIPLWKNQIVIAITLYRQQQALGVQKQVTDMTNELLAKNAALLKDGSAKVAREVERGVVDIETLRQVNADLIGTIEETLRIQEEARTRRVQAEGELVQMQGQLKQKLLEVRSQAPLVGGGRRPARSAARPAQPAARRRRLRRRSCRRTRRRLTAARAEQRGGAARRPRPLCGHGGIGGMIRRGCDHQCAARNEACRTTRRYSAPAGATNRVVNRGALRVLAACRGLTAPVSPA